MDLGRVIHPLFTSRTVPLSGTMTLKIRVQFLTGSAIFTRLAGTAWNDELAKPACKAELNHLCEFFIKK